MTDPTPNDLRQPIDARSLIASEAIRGAIGGFCWSLLLTVPLAWTFWNHPPPAGRILAVLISVPISLIWAALAANARVGRARENLFTDEQRAILARYTGRTGVQGLCCSLPFALLLLVGTWGHGAFGAIFLALVLIGLCTGCAARVGQALGRRKVRAMQREAKAKAGQADSRMSRPDSALRAEPSEQVQREEKRQPVAHYPFDAGLED
jgi:hypothetical protein